MKSYRDGEKVPYGLAKRIAYGGQYIKCVTLRLPILAWFGCKYDPSWDRMVKGWWWFSLVFRKQANSFRASWGWSLESQKYQVVAG